MGRSCELGFTRSGDCSLSIHLVSVVADHSTKAGSHRNEIAFGDTGLLFVLVAFSGDSRVLLAKMFVGGGEFVDPSS